MYSFRDITLYAETPLKNNDPQYREDTGLINYVSDLYVRHMNGYKPPNTTRVSVQAGPAKMWDRTWKNGSLCSIAVLFDYDRFSSLEKEGKYQYILDIIQGAMLELSTEYGWDDEVFLRAYEEVVACGFKFRMDFPSKQARNRKTAASLTLVKTEHTAEIVAHVTSAQGETDVVLVRKKNWYWYDSTYDLVKDYKWFDNERFGVSHKQLGLNIWYDISRGAVFQQLGADISVDMDIEKILLL